MLGLSCVERILLANAVEVGAVVGAVNGASFRSAAIAAGLSHRGKMAKSTGLANRHWIKMATPVLGYGLGNGCRGCGGETEITVTVKAHSMPEGYRIY
jgi:hypothetical protein